MDQKILRLGCFTVAPHPCGQAGHSNWQGYSTRQATGPRHWTSRAHNVNARLYRLQSASTCRRVRAHVYKTSSSRGGISQCLAGLHRQRSSIGHRCERVAPLLQSLPPSSMRACRLLLPTCKEYEQRPDLMFPPLCGRSDRAAKAALAYAMQKCVSNCPRSLCE